jgi:hypothetical protein
MGDRLDVGWGGIVNKVSITWIKTHPYSLVY